MIHISRRLKACRPFLLLIAVVSLAVAAAPLNPANSWYAAWGFTYPASVSDDNVIIGTTDNCQLCHEDLIGDDGWNAYGSELRMEWVTNSFNVPLSIADVGGIDSDGDGTSNVFEIDAGTQPGWRPGAVNTIFFKNGNTTLNNPPPAGILGDLDPACGTVVHYCKAGKSRNDCMAMLTTTGTADLGSSFGFDVIVSGAPGNVNAIFYYGWNGRQANQWGNGTSFQCVMPPVKRTGIISTSGTSGQCNGSSGLDFNTYWWNNFPKRPPPDTLVQIQFWYRDATNTSNQKTSLSDAIEVWPCP